MDGLRAGLPEGWARVEPVTNTRNRSANRRAAERWARGALGRLTGGWALGKGDARSKNKNPNYPLYAEAAQLPHTQG